jgi:carbon starvation protein
MGLKFPCELSADTWKIILFVYVFFASVTPVWILLQPRDYLCSFLLYAVIIAGVIGIFAANPQIQSPGLTAFNVEGMGTLFPILFVTVACGAISGFHSLVSAGTTAKQLNRETDARPVAYGSMLIEGLLAVMALITATAITRGQYTEFMSEGGGGAIAVFSTGLGTFLAKLGISQRAGTTFAALAISAFALTTLDTATRLGRFMFQEFFEEAGKKTFLGSNRYVGTLVTITAAALTFTGSRATLWPLFGSANQLLASLTFLAVTVWLTRLGRTSTFIKIPMVFMFCVTITALACLVYKNLRDGNYVLVVMAVLLLGVAVTLVAKAWASLAGTSGSVPQNQERALT